MNTDPPQRSIDIILATDAFADSVAQVAAAFPEDATASHVRWAFIRHMGWDVYTSYDERYSTPKMSLLQKNAVSYAQNAYTGSEIGEISTGFGPVDYVRTFGTEFASNSVRVLSPVARGFGTALRNPYWILFGVAVIVLVPPVLNSVRTLKKS